MAGARVDLSNDELVRNDSHLQKQVTHTARSATGRGDRYGERLVRGTDLAAAPPKPLKSL